MKTALLAAVLLVMAPAAWADDPLTTAEAAMDAAWAQTPFAVRQAFFVQAEPTLFGVYDKRADGPFKPGEAMVVYAEPVGYAFKDNKDGTVSFGFDIDVAIKSPKGKVGFEQKSWQKISVVSHAHNHESYLALTLEVTGSDPGDYVLDYTIHDQISGKTVDVALPFTLAK